MMVAIYAKNAVCVIKNVPLMFTLAKFIPDSPNEFLQNNGFRPNACVLFALKLHSPSSLDYRDRRRSHRLPMVDRSKEMTKAVLDAPLLLNAYGSKFCFSRSSKQISPYNFYFSKSDVAPRP